MAVTLLWLKGLSNVQCALVGPVDVASGLVSFGCKTVAPFSCTSCLELLHAVCVTVATV